VRDAACPFSTRGGGRRAPRAARPATDATGGARVHLVRCPLSTACVRAGQGAGAAARYNLAVLLQTGAAPPTPDDGGLCSQSDDTAAAPAAEDPAVPAGGGGAWRAGLGAGEAAAAAQYEAVLRAEPRHPSALCNLAALRRRAGAPAEEVELLYITAAENVTAARAGRRRDGRSADVWFSYGAFLAEARAAQPGAARRAFAEALRAHERHVPTLQARAPPAYHFSYGPPYCSALSTEEA